VARLDERLANDGEDVAAGMMQRLALRHVSDILWAEGVRVRSEQLALAAEDRLGLSAEDIHAASRADWAVRRWTAGAGDLDTVEGMRSFLGLHAARSSDEEDAWASRPDPAALAEWVEAVGMVGDVHPLTRAAFAYSLWQGWELSPVGRKLEGVMVAACLGAADLQVLRAVPVDPGSHGGGVAERLRGWLDAVERGASQGLILIKRCREWEGRAIRRIGDLKGKGAPRLVAVLACRPLVSAKAASRMLGISQTQARALLNEFENRGLIRERTGHRRFRFWEARL
jgi:hypothetical protein